jgi:hypothetical protein
MPNFISICFVNNMLLRIKFGILEHPFLKPHFLFKNSKPFKEWNVQKVVFMKIHS